ncbi:MAG: polyprenyl synthetase family protein [Henriciella sp.]|uniref:polyprenyl synthetase family protein n=1 Tax=Henriciella sp. TaxID=1968823 RepID=UPI003C74719C
MTVDAQISAYLEQALCTGKADNCPPKLKSALQHAVFPGGARVRPKLCLAVASACEPGVDLSDALAAAAALELLHCASLVHDDLPCFDDADQRRGKASVHIRYGEPIAVLAGDAMIVLAFQTLALKAPTYFRELTLVMADATAPPNGICAGQAWESEAEIDLEAYHNSKTAALFVAATRAGAVSVGASDAGWRPLGEYLGQAYQLADDLRDAVLSPEDLGKPAKQDTRNCRPSAVESYGVSGTYQRLRGAIEAAADSVPLCAGTESLRQLIHAQAVRLTPEHLVQDVA